MDWDKQDPSLLEGDIKVVGDKNAILGSSYRWPSAIIPYVISEDYSKSIANRCNHHLVY